MRMKCGKQIVFVQKTSRKQRFRDEENQPLKKLYRPKNRMKAMIAGTQ